MTTHPTSARCVRRWCNSRPTRRRATRRRYREQQLDGASRRRHRRPLNGVYWNDRGFRPVVRGRTRHRRLRGERRLVVAFDAQQDSKLTSYALPASTPPVLADVRSRSCSSGTDSMPVPATSKQDFCDVAIASSTTLSSDGRYITTGVSNDRFGQTGHERAQMVTFLQREAETNGQPGARVRDVLTMRLRRGSPVGEGPGHHRGRLRPRFPTSTPSRGANSSPCYGVAKANPTRDTTSFSDVPEGRYFTQAVG